MSRDRPGSTWRSLPGWAAFALLAVLLAGCAANNPPERQVSLPDPPRQTEPSTAAQREHQRILASYGGAYRNPRLEALLSKTLERLVAASDRPDLQYRITLLNSPAVNAFALPTGHLYVTRGLLALTNDSSEIASVLAHEMAHVLARHAAIREDKARQAAMVTQVVSDLLNDPQTGALALARSKIDLASFSRAQELEADAIGVSLSARAGYDPYGATRFLSAMGRNAGLRAPPSNSPEQRVADFLSSHPSTPERVGNALSNARQHSAPGTGSRDRPAYLSATDGLAYGEDPSDGYVRGRRFLHPKLGVTFTAPSDFSLENTSQAVLGLKQGGGEALRLDVVRLPAEQALTDYLTSGWIETVDPRSIETLTLNGFDAATAVAKGEQWTFRLYVLRADSDVYRFVFAARRPSPESERAYRESVGTFHRMTAAEIIQVRPLRIQVVTVKPGDTAERLAARMPTDRPLERFLVLNGLNHGDALTPGMQVKVVVE